MQENQKNDLLLPVSDFDKSLFKSDTPNACRKWQVVFMNPLDPERNWTHDNIKLSLSKLKNIDYWCMCDEIGLENQTYHTHLYIYRQSGIKFSKLHDIFPSVHLIACNGSSQANRDYIRKEGKYQLSDKHDTNLIETFEESGELPDEKGQGHRSDYDDLYQGLKDGLSDFEILEKRPSLMTKLPSIRDARNVLRDEQFKKVYRKLDVTYISGTTRSGKTSYVMNKHGFDCVSRITDWRHPFDHYDGEDVILFDEFRSSLPLSDMLVYLDGYPLQLPARFANRTACYTKVYIISNIPLDLQYPSIHQDDPESWKAFLARINHVILINDEIEQYDSVEAYFKRPVKFENADDSPFKSPVKKYEYNQQTMSWER